MSDYDSIAGKARYNELRDSIPTHFNLWGEQVIAFLQQTMITNLSVMSLARASFEWEKAGPLGEESAEDQFMYALGVKKTAMEMSHQKVIEHLARLSVHTINMLASQEGVPIEERQAKMPLLLRILSPQVALNDQYLRDYTPEEVALAGQHMFKQFLSPLQ